MMRQGAVSPFISVPDTIGELLLAVGASVLFGQEGKIHVEGYNDMTIPMTMGCTWRVEDPNGIVVEEHTDDWAGWPWPTDVNPDDTHEFISPGSFDLNRTGIWRIWIWLWMNVDSPVMVDSYEGVLCVVEEEVFAGHISKQELEYDSVRGTIPVY